MDHSAALIFLGCCLFIPMICMTVINGEPDVITVKEYIEVPKEIIVEKYIQQPVKKKINPLMPDAIQCLVSLGMKKSEASSLVKTMFSKKNYESIESFLIDAYKI